MKEKDRYVPTRFMAETSHYDKDKADYAVNFIQLLSHTKGTWSGKKFKLLGIFVNMANYQFGCAKGGEVTSFDDFDLDFNTFKYLMETRLSGALTEVYSAIALEEPVAAAADGQG